MSIGVDHFEWISHDRSFQYLFVFVYASSERTVKRALGTRINPVPLPSLEFRGKAASAVKRSELTIRKLCRAESSIMGTEGVAYEESLFVRTTAYLDVVDPHSNADFR